MSSISTQVRAHDPSAHKGWSVDWCNWLVSHGFNGDGSEIIATDFTVPAPAVATFKDLVGSVATVFINGVPDDTELTIVASIEMPSPGGAAPTIEDFRSFKIRGSQT